MQTPPQHDYGTQTPKSNSRTIWIVVIAILVGGGCLCLPIGAALLFPVLSQARLAAQETASLSNVKQLNLALQLYAGEWDDHLPRADNWCKAISQGLDNKAFHDPSLGTYQERPYGYALNEAAPGISLSSLTEPERAVLIFTSIPRKENAVGTITDARETKRGFVMIGLANGSARKLKIGNLGAYDWPLQRKLGK